MVRERAADVRQVGRRVLERIAHNGAGVSSSPDTRRFVLVADEIGPADLLEHLGLGLVGAVTVRGGANSHAAIVARSVGLPLVTGVDPQVLDLPDDTALLVDADAGVVVVEPAEADVANADAATVRDEARRTVLAAERGLPHVTGDGQPFVLLCNVASDIEVRVGRDGGAAYRAALPRTRPVAGRGRPPARTAPDPGRSRRVAGHAAAARLRQRQGPAVPARRPGRAAGAAGQPGRTDRPTAGGGRPRPRRTAADHGTDGGRSRRGAYRPGRG